MIKIESEIKKKKMLANVLTKTLDMTGSNIFKV